MKYTYECDYCGKIEVDELQYSLRLKECCNMPMWYSDKQALYMKQEMYDVFLFDRANYMQDLTTKQGGLEELVSSKEPLILPIIRDDE